MITTEYRAFAVIGSRVKYDASVADSLYGKRGNLEILMDSDNESAFVGAVSIAGHCEYGRQYLTEMTSLPDVKEVKRQCWELLNPLGLWDEKEFGLWAVLHCSH